ncbi:periaxin [Galendromus occidentalis]|uniref:Periaxin n=1 Tax=Galendromus occidentalis TaxID=34638 RepID=A0AAJ6QWA6_9ACAR|nr:periaxin [Galendromus occidentalis]
MRYSAVLAFVLVKTADAGFLCSQGEGLFPDPRNCGRFIQCMDWHPHLFDCPSQLHFNPGTRMCDWPSQAGCSVEANGDVDPVAVIDPVTESAGGSSEATGSDQVKKRADEAGGEDSKTPDATIPDAKPTEAKMKESKTTDAVMKGSKTTDAKMPEIEIPDEEIDIAEIPKAEIPDAAKKKESKTADANMPKVEIPNAEIPDSKIPKAKTPDEKIPIANVSEAEVPAAKMPDAERSKDEIDSTWKKSIEKGFHNRNLGRKDSRRDYSRYRRHRGWSRANSE